MKTSILIWTSLISAVFSVPFSAFAQGTLNPPGPPGPTMKRLDEVEPRTNLQATPAPAGVDTSNANYHFVINQPGSYYLSANLAVTKANGIQVNAEGVTLDLNGFQISRGSGSGGTGIEIVLAANRTTVRNGSIKGFAVGVNSLNSGTGTPAYARGCAFRDLSVSGCSANGLVAGSLAVVESCRAHDNTGAAAIYAPYSAVMTNCTADHNTTTYGIAAGNGSSLTNCAANENTGFAGINVGIGSSLTNCSAHNNAVNFGIDAGSGSTLSNCTAFYNNGGGATTSAGIATGPDSTLHACTSSLNQTTVVGTPTAAMGFDVARGSTIQKCTATANHGDGINITSNCFVKDNACVSNNGGIHALENDNRIEGNNLTGNQRGLDVDAAGNFIVRNSASGNFLANYDIAAGNYFGVISNVVPAAGLPTPPPVNGSSAPSSILIADPWANISY